MNRVMKLAMSLTASFNDKVGTGAFSSKEMSHFSEVEMTALSLELR